jgi:hypothetical protein
MGKALLTVNFIKRVCLILLINIYKKYLKGDKMYDKVYDKKDVRIKIIIIVLILLLLGAAFYIFKNEYDKKIINARYGGFLQGQNSTIQIVNQQIITSLQEKGYVDFNIPVVDDKGQVKLVPVKLGIIK